MRDPLVPHDSSSPSRLTFPLRGMTVDSFACNRPFFVDFASTIMPHIENRPWRLPPAHNFDSFQFFYFIFCIGVQLLPLLSTCKIPPKLRRCIRIGCVYEAWFTGISCTTKLLLWCDRVWQLSQCAYTVMLNRISLHKFYWSPILSLVNFDILSDNIRYQSCIIFYLFLKISTMNF